VKDFLQGFISKLVRALSRLVGLVFSLLVFEIVRWVRPQQVAQQARQGRLLKPIDFIDVVHIVEVGTNASMNTQIVIVHFDSEG
jgi:hypothetical protein